MGIEEKWAGWDLDEIVRHFARGFVDADGGTIKSFEYFIDAHKRTVVFKLYVEPKKESKNHESERSN